MRKNNVKRMTAVLLAAGMMSSLTACGGGESAPKETSAPAAEKKESSATEAVEGELVAEEGAEIEVAYWEGSTSDKEAWDELLANLQKDHPEIKIVDQTYPSNDYPDMLDTRIAGDDWPDVMRYKYQQLGKFKQADVMLDLSPYMSQESLDDISPAFLSACQYDGKLVALPHHTDTIATVYKGNIIKNLIMDCQSYTKYRPNETTGGIFVSWRRKEELPTGA